MVLRSWEPERLAPRLHRLQLLGVRHVEIAWRPGQGWSDQCRQLIAAFPELLLGAASICTPAALVAALEAGFSYGVSPVLERQLLEQAAAADFTLVPGVMTPTEVNRARSWGCPIVKLFPAVTVGMGYWRRLADPLGAPMPFCIAAGGLHPHDVRPWLEAGVDAVALGASLPDSGPEAAGAAAAHPDSLEQLLADLAGQP
ncbi:bifunctional 4-hydroxy-2-oxoglutarate aldolase/2-dehydro-3-deoxy-phosphogluconate aldolase [Synechococcus sp. CCY 9618]|uniref:bifunctional 4-hydroxy-2-oxoglutarate aldolase/2-dehydro-3-deoxy-phosphogluconate aldolase n=1 Tax=Synechococcus sp. CCY 9618 TaxID=2815602 RepID=UPI00352D351D